MPRAESDPPASASSPGLYIHVPFCRIVCPYCDFAVRTGTRARRAAYTDWLLREVELCAGESWAAFDSVYFGGGTPSLLEPQALARLLEGLRAAFSIEPGALIFLEANPEDVTPARLGDWRALGVGFLSLGVQALDDESLRFLRRRHSAADARRSLVQALEAGLSTVSVDLIYGLPGERPAAWRRTLDEVVGLGPQHLSCYQLGIHEGTLFGRLRRRGELEELDQDTQAELFALTHNRLGAAGYDGYEVSNFALGPEHRSRHNQKYWRHVPYLGLGPSAHSFDGRRRWWNARRLEDWERRLEAGERPVAGSETLGREQLALESLMLGLRTSDGVDLDAFHQRYGLDLEQRNAANLGRQRDAGLLEIEGRRLRATLAGLAVADALAAGLDIGSEEAELS